MSINEIRGKFLKFFEKRRHKIVPSSSLMPDDSSVLFTTAGMQQFKPYYTGAADPMKDFGSKNVASCQKCVRTSDIDEVGDESHLTFFEMLGNFSFGGYGKKEAIELAFDFIKKELNLKISKVSVFGGDAEILADEESEKIWQKIIEKEKDKDIDIIKGNREDNFWGPTGNEGPCGPTTEIYIKNAEGKDIEIWNIVFNQYYKNRNGSFKEIPLGIDTGMGLERLAMVLQEKKDVYEIDAFKPVYDFIKDNISELNEKSIRIIADHLRASTFLIADGIEPSNTERGYILRRLLRRARYYYDSLGAHDKPLGLLVEYVIPIYKETEYGLDKKLSYIEEIISSEEMTFVAHLGFGRKLLEKIIKNDGRISGENAFLLYSTYGFPFELIFDIAKENNVEIDVNGFQEKKKQHQEISRAGVEKKFGGHGLVMDTGELKAGSEEEIKKVTRLHTATHLLHSALRMVLGGDIQQRGSDITSERARFDFVYPQKMTDEQKKKVEDILNDIIKKDYAVKREEMPFEEAIKSGALAFFKGKYPPVVNVYIIYNSETGEIFSKEVCGGPHIDKAGEIGYIKILKEESSSAGVRRIRAKIA